MALPPKARSVTPCAEGLAERLSDRRNCWNPATEASASSIRPDAVAGIFALRTLAVRRGELIRETAYLVDVLRPLLPAIFKEWKIGEDLVEYVRAD